MTKLYSVCVVLLICFGKLCGQVNTVNESPFPSGLTIEYGIGHYSVKDEYISKEAYSGSLPTYTVRWARKHDAYVYHLDMQYRTSSSISNFNVTTDITQFILNQGFLYPIGKLSLFHKSLFLWLGPSTEFFFFFNDQNIAVAGFDYAQSFAGLFSLGLNVEGVYPVSRTIFLESSLRFTVLSLGFRMVDTEEDDQSPVNLLSVFSSTNTSFGFGVRYYLWNRMSVKLAYKIELTRIHAWDPLLSASDNLVFGLNYRF